MKTAFLLPVSVCLGLLFCSMPGYAISGITTDKAPPHFATNENREDIEDLQVSVLGGVIRIDRRWNGEQWEWNKRWEDIGEEPDQSIIEAKLAPKTVEFIKTTGSGGGGGGLKLGMLGSPYLFRNGQAYRRAPGEDVTYENQLSKTIAKSGSGYVWKDRENNHIYYNKNGQMTHYTDANGVRVSLVRDANGYIEELRDHHDNVVVDYQWEDIPGATPIKNVNDDLYTPRRLVSLTDYTGRQVIYHWDINNRLVKVTDVLGYDWQYTYGATGELTSQIDPENRIVKYSISKKGRVSSRTDDNGSGDTYSYRYDADKKEYYLSSTDQTGKVIESWYDKRGVEIRRLINGDLQFTATVIDSDGNKGVEKIDKRYLRFSGGSSGGGGGGGGKMLPFDLFEKPVYVKSKTLTDVRGNKTLYEYDQWGNIVKLTYPDGATVSATWHTSMELPLSETNEKGIITAYEYDDKGNLLTLIEAKGTSDQRISRYTYDQYGQIKTITTGESSANNTALATTSFDYDSYGNVTTITDQEGYVTKFQDYDALGNPKKIIDARANSLAEGQQYAWENTYDAAGNLLSNLNPDGIGDVYTYSAAGMLKTLTSADGNFMTLTANASGLPLTLTDANDKVTQLQYDKENRLTQIVDANGNKFQLVYDKHGRYERIIDGEGQATQFTYVDNLLRSIQFPTYKEIVDYDNRDREKQTTQQANNRNYLRKKGYDLANNLIQSTDANDKTTSYEYDALNRIKKIVDANSGVTEFVYDARDNLLQVKDPEGRLTLFTYDKNDQLLTETKDGDQSTGKQRQYVYDQSGNVTTSINQEQEKTTHDYDRSNRLIKTSVYAHKDHTQPVKVINYNINTKDQMTGWSQSVSSNLPEGITLTADIIALSETFIYSNLGQLESVTSNFGSFSKTYSYTYYPNGQRKTYTNPENITYTYYYNKNNQLMAVHIPGNGQISYAAFHWMMPQTLLLPGGQTVTLKYNDFQQVKERILKNSSDQTLATALYEYDLESNIQKITKGEGVFNYTYDNLYRLTGADSPEGYAANDETFYYDGVGNRETRTENNVIESQTYNAKNQLQAISTITGEEATTETIYTHNANGHTKTQISNGVTTEYNYNHEERLIAVKRNGETLAEYVYNPRGQRVRKTVNGETTWYLYNRNGLAAEYTGAGLLIKEYHFHPQKHWMTDPLFMKTAAGSYYYYHNDQLGTPQQLIDSTGQVVWQAQYSAFGKAIITISTVENNLRFPGQYYDQETQLHHNYMRDYDPVTGRYLQEDPLGIASSINYYVYGYQNPLSYIDPTGEVGVVGAAVGAITDVALQLAMNGGNWSCISVGQVVLAAALGAVGAGLAANAKKAKELNKLRQLSKDKGLVPNKITPHIEDYINPNNPIERLKIKLSPSQNATGSLSKQPRVEYRVEPGTYQNPFTGEVGSSVELSHVPFGIPSTAGTVTGGMAGGAVAAQSSGCGQCN